MLTRSTSVNVIAGCFDCNGSEAIWTAKNAMAVAARHAEAKGHKTWADQTLSVRYACVPVEKAKTS
ncbi:conserved hypothetical protein [Hyphomicrobiales bacterium]|jgi:hypothetical protein|nr:conserved hypothetical protein [Hyphomicrobiales bacterium]CAH1702420.1 hypothetical protein BOSEA1005_30292 [Hyphomicrobiales bacterium]CAI0346620.1 conserved hypothetical protein [Hyphomicrobiales bacterium]